MPVPVLALQRHRCNLETAPGDRVEVNRNVGLTQLCNKQKAGKTHPFGILCLAVLAAKIGSGETPCCWVYFTSEGSRVDLGCLPTSMCPSGWGRAQAVCPVPSDWSCLLVHSQVAPGTGKHLHVWVSTQRRLWLVWSLLWVGDGGGCSGLLPPEGQCQHRCLYTPS